MKEISTVKIASFPANEMVLVECPCCGNWTEQSNLDPRRKISSFEILKWFDTENDEDEKSLMKCTSCTEDFELIWDYNNLEHEQK